MKKSFVTVAARTNQERKIGIKSWSKSQSKEGRVVSVIELDDKEGYILQVSNPPSSERSLNQEMWLSEKTFKMLLISCTTLGHCSEDLDMQNSFQDLNDCDFAVSDNLDIYNQKE